MSESVEIFISYAHEDESYLKDLTKHLELLVRRGSIRPWSDANIDAGMEWKKAIDTHLDTAQVFLLLISANFMASEYCYGIEMKRAVERHEHGGARVIPIILSAISKHEWETAPFSKLQALPKDAKPIKRWRDREEAYASIIDGIHAAIKQVTTEPSVTSTGIHAQPLEPASPVSEQAIASFEAGEVEKKPIVSSHSLAPTPSTLRLRDRDAMNTPLIIETHERLITIGRAPKNMVKIPDDTVSWEHGRIIFEEGEYHYCHLSKSRPTILRRRDLERLFRGGKNEEMQLRNLDRLIIGARTFVVEFDLVNEDGEYKSTDATR